ncbi:MAG: hypothetical protein EXQ58_00500 [Acidobacteria bacterium]|nr:hypothetical protein [Acidobacteriota bacterium]
MTDPRILEVVQAIFPGSPILPKAVMFFAKQAESGSVTPAHQHNVFQHWAPPEALAVTLSVDESTPANGPLICLKGSHKLGVLPHRQSGVMGFSRTLDSPVDTQLYPEVPLCMKPGDVALHHINTIHRSESNQSRYHRRQRAISYRSSRAQRDEQSFQRYLKDLDQLHREHSKGLGSDESQS